jgi:hypothetical protein
MTKEVNYDDGEFVLPEGSLLYMDGNRGIYIPQQFAQETKHECVAGVNQEEWDILEYGPDHDEYWDVWNYVEQNAVLTDPDSGIKYTLYQDDDLWLIPKD